MKGRLRINRCFSDTSRTMLSTPARREKGPVYYDTIVDITDLGILATNWKKTLAPPAALRIFAARRQSASGAVTDRIIKQILCVQACAHRRGRARRGSCGIGGLTNLTADGCASGEVRGGARAARAIGTDAAHVTTALARCFTPPVTPWMQTLGAANSTGFSLSRSLCCRGSTQLSAREIVDGIPNVSGHGQADAAAPAGGD
jgi:hypothetical protein